MRKINLFGELLKSSTSLRIASFSIFPRTEVFWLKYSFCGILLFVVLWLNMAIIEGVEADAMTVWMACG